MTAEVQSLNYMELVERPQELIRNSQEIASEFQKIVEGQKLYTDIAGKKHVHVDGWSMLGVLFGIFPTVDSVERVNTGVRFEVVKVKTSIKFKDKHTGVWKEFDKEAWLPKDRVKKTDAILQEATKDEITYKAVVILRTLKGHSLTRVESLCSNREDGKLDNEEYAINSMAQTRATGKAFRLAFGWIARVAGYDSTPFEEVGDMYPDREVAQKPHASLDVLDAIRNKINGATTKAEYTEALKELAKYDADLNEDDKDQVREWCMAALQKLKSQEPVETPNPTPNDAQ